MSKQKVQFYFDYNSPYSYFASLLIEEICDRHGAELLWDPIVLGGIFKEDGTTPAHAISKRATYLEQDLKNLSEFYGIPYKKRTTFLFNPILSQRATLQVPQGTERARAVHALYRGAFQEDLDLGDPEVVKELLQQAGFDGAALVEGSQQQEVKDALKRNTEEALAKDVFGAPTCILNDEMMFWGHDRLKVLDYFMGKSKNG
jgi:2-hydroxychromene-2-carboxylate isomerase